jgi:hypothetical protein
VLRKIIHKKIATNLQKNTNDIRTFTAQERAIPHAGLYPACCLYLRDHDAATTLADNYRRNRCRVEAWGEQFINIQNGKPFP